MSIRCPFQSRCDFLNRAKPKRALYYHISLQGDPGVPALTEKDIEDATRTTYSGPLVMGDDLMAFVIEEDGARQITR